MLLNKIADIFPYQIAAYANAVDVATVSDGQLMLLHASFKGSRMKNGIKVFYCLLLPI